MRCPCCACCGLAAVTHVLAPLHQSQGACTPAYPAPSLLLTQFPPSWQPCHLVCAVVQRFLERGGPEVQAAVGEAIRGKALPLSLQVGRGGKPGLIWVGLGPMACWCCTCAALPVLHCEPTALCCCPSLTAHATRLPLLLLRRCMAAAWCRRRWRWVVPRQQEHIPPPPLQFCRVQSALFAYCSLPCTAVLCSPAVMRLLLPPLSLRAALLLPPLSLRAALAGWCCRCCPRRRACPFVRS